MPTYKVSYWTMIEAESKEEAIEEFIRDIDAESVDAKEVR